jgi:hypothetical protein
MPNFQVPQNDQYGIPPNAEWEIYEYRGWSGTLEPVQNVKIWRREGWPMFIMRLSDALEAGFLVDLDDPPPKKWCVKYQMPFVRWAGEQECDRIIAECPSYEYAQMICYALNDRKGRSGYAYARELPA